jgi:hypothetical protein
MIPRRSTISSLALLFLLLALGRGEVAIAQSRPSASGQVWVHHARPIPEFDYSLTFQASGGNRIRGQVFFRAPSLDQWFAGSVDACFYQADNLAVFGGTITSSHNLGSAERFQIGVRDAGSDRNAVDLAEVEVGSEAPSCSPVLSLISSGPVISGDLRVSGGGSVVRSERNRNP